MQAVRLFGVGDVQLADVPKPAPGPDEVVVQVEACGICGTDRHLFLGEFPSTPPVTLGHEFSGIVCDVGDGVNLSLGTRVTCDPNIPCLSCPHCLCGRVNLCSNNRPTGVGRDGGFAPFALIPARNAIALPADLHPHHGAFCEPLACTLHGLDMANLRPGERCLILGGGVIGLLALQLARNAGSEVMMLTRSRAKQELALSLGATHVATSADQALAIWPAGADAVIECAGVVDTVQSAPTLTATGGRIVILGVLPKGTKVTIEPFDLLFREIQMLHSFLNPFTHARAAHMIAAKAVSVAPLISRLLTLPEALAAIRSPAPQGEVRALVVPQ